MGGRSPYQGWFGGINVPEEPDTSEHIDFKLEDFDFSNGVLNFKIVKYSSRKIAVRYTTINYEKYPVEWRDSIRSCNIFKYHKHIELKRFSEIELRNLPIEDKFKYIIMQKLGYTPTWRQKELELAKETKELKKLENSLKKKLVLEDELKPIEDDYSAKISEIDLKIRTTKSKPDSKKIIILRSIFTIFTLGLSWIGFISKNKSIKNKNKIKNWNIDINNLNKNKINDLNSKKKEVHLKNEQIDVFNLNIEKKISNIQSNIVKIKTKDYTSVVIEDNFIDLRKKLPTITKFNCKGVYVIWNKSKNLYYVGQSKDVYRRLFTQHFNNNNVKNIIFAKDWFDGDEFYYKVIPLQTKDELDEKEKELIEKYDSFKHGYNATWGNY